MVVENPIPDEKREEINRAIEEKIGGDFSQDNAQTAEDSNYDFVIIGHQIRTRKMRKLRLKVKWHDEFDDWEVMVDWKGAWMS